MEENCTNYGEDKRQDQRQRMQIDKHGNATYPKQPRGWKREAQGAGSS